VNNFNLQSAAIVVSCCVKVNRPKRAEQTKAVGLKSLMAEYDKRAEDYIKHRADGVPVRACLAAFLAPPAAPRPENLLFTLRNRGN
jgi:hypothetical protein